MIGIEQFLVDIANFIWGTPLLIWLMGGGVFFAFYSRFLPLFYFKHAIEVLCGKYDESEGEGEISHFEALSSHLAATVGMGNIAGVAVAISMGGPGAIFWMWISAFFGMATKFFTCTLAVMYRGKDSVGKIQGGPMYVIMEGMGKKWKPLALFFAICMALAASPIFQTNQLVMITKGVLLEPLGLVTNQIWITNLLIGIIVAIFSLSVILGGIKRIAVVAAKMVPMMILLYMGCVLFIIFSNHELILPSFWLILSDAFTGNAALGGAVGAVIVIGARRAAFSNEAGIGSAPMMHGAAKTNEPVREGLVAMLGPFIDTIVVCTMTALCILITGVWQIKGLDGIELMVMAFEKSMSYFGPIILSICVLIFSFTTIFGVAYYGRKSVEFVFGVHNGHYFNIWYVLSILMGSILSLSAAVGFLDICFALLSIPTMLSAIYLAPKVMAEAKRYLSNIN